MFSKEKIIITGSEGVIGTVVKKGLRRKYSITALDLPKNDVRELSMLLKVFPGHSTVIHLAWNSNTEGFSNGQVDPDCFLMAHNVYEAALQTGISRVIMASSIHADGRYRHWTGQPLKADDQRAQPDSPYGQDKIRIEHEGKAYADKGLDVISIRFGGVNPKNTPPTVREYGDTQQERSAWLSHNDCVRLMEAILKTPARRGRFVSIYGASSTTVLDTSNPFGWLPQDNPDK